MERRNILLAAAMMTGLACADPIKDPARMRINAEILQTVFHKGDQRILDVFDNIDVGRVDSTDEPGFPDFALDDMVVSLRTNEGIDLEDYDIKISLNDEALGFLGFQGDDLRVLGSASYAGVAFSFEAPVSAMRLVVELVQDEDEDAKKINIDAMMPTAKEFVFELGEVTLSDSYSGGDDLKGGIQYAVKVATKEAMNSAYDSIWEGNFQRLGKLPLESFLPMLLLKQIGSVARTFKISPQSLEYGFDPEVFYKNDRPYFKKKKSMLKEIDSVFTEGYVDQHDNPKSGDYAVQLILDENVVNAFLLDFVLYEKAFSLRDIMKMDNKMQPFLQQMNTTMLGMMLPSILEEFGENRQIDLYASLSHSLIAKKIENAKVSGFQIDRNGNFRFVFNFQMTVLVEKKHAAYEFEEARSMYVGLTLKGKLIVKEVSATDKMLVLTPKGAEVSSLKIFDAKDNEMVAEQMMLTAGINVQLEQAVGMLPPQEFPMKNPPTPKELECLGFALGDIDLFFRKGYMEVAFGYKKVEFPSDVKVCETFLEAIRQGPKEFMDGASNFLGSSEPGAAKDYLAQKKAELNEHIEGMKGKARADDKAEQAQEKASTIEMDEL